MSPNRRIEQLARALDCAPDTHSMADEIRRREPRSFREDDRERIVDLLDFLMASDVAWNWVTGGYSPVPPDDIRDEMSAAVERNGASVAYPAAIARAVVRVLRYMWWAHLSQGGGVSGTRLMSSRTEPLTLS